MLVDACPGGLERWHAAGHAGAEQAGQYVTGAPGCQQTIASGVDRGDLTGRSRNRARPFEYHRAL